MTTDLLAPAASLEEDGELGSLSSKLALLPYRHEQLEITDTPVILAGRLPPHPTPLTSHVIESRELIFGSEPCKVNEKRIPAHYQGS